MERQQLEGVQCSYLLEPNPRKPTLTTEAVLLLPAFIPTELGCFGKEESWHPTNQMTPHPFSSLFLKCPCAYFIRGGGWGAATSVKVAILQRSVLGHDWFVHLRCSTVVSRLARYVLPYFFRLCVVRLLWYKSYFSSASPSLCTGGVYFPVLLTTCG